MTFSTQPEPRADDLSRDELSSHATQLGIDPSLIKVQGLDPHDSITITIAKPDGRSLKRVVPRESWDQPEYRSSLIANMGSILA